MDYVDQHPEHEDAYRWACAVINCKPNPYEDTAGRAEVFVPPDAKTDPGTPGVRRVYLNASASALVKDRSDLRHNAGALVESDEPVPRSYVNVRDA
jgi:hypothetical protein